jgi:hypothetical protein
VHTAKHCTCPLAPQLTAHKALRVLLPCCRAATVLSCCCRAAAVLPSCHYRAAVACCRAAAVLPCCCRAVAVLLPCCCRAVLLPAFIYSIIDAAQHLQGPCVRAAFGSLFVWGGGGPPLSLGRSAPVIQISLRCHSSHPSPGLAALGGPIV